MRIAIVGSRKMSRYGQAVIEKIMVQLRNEEVVTIEVSGCNREVIRQGAKKVFRGKDFDRLNEELADYADLLVIVEGAKNSGTLLLAEKFLTKGKEIYCVPGRITDEDSYATNWLIAQGARVIWQLGNLTQILQ